MIFPFRHTRTKCFLALLVVGAFLGVSLWQSSHVHHQHGSADAELAFGPRSFVALFSGWHGGDAEPHGEHNHQAPDKTAHLYKNNTGGKTLRGKTDADNQLKIPALVSVWGIEIPNPEASTSHAPYAKEGSGVWMNTRPPARAPPFIAVFA